MYIIQLNEFAMDSDMLRLLYDDNAAIDRIVGVNVGVVIIIVVVVVERFSVQLTMTSSYSDRKCTNQCSVH